MKEPTLKSEVLGMMPETWTPKTKLAVFNHSIRKEYYLGDMTWSMKVSDAKERFSEFSVDAFLATIRENMPQHIERFMWRNER
jgi:hypothetical protein